MKELLKKGNIKIIAIEIILLIVLFFNSFVFKIVNTWEIVGILLLFLIVTILLLGFEKRPFRSKKDVLINIIIILLLYYFITYFLGFFTGFNKNGYSLSLINIVKNTFPFIILIVVSELLRFSLMIKSGKNMLLLIVGHLVFVLIDINLSIHLYDVTTYVGLTKMICLVLFPSITKNIFLIYLVEKSGYENAIIYRFITELNMYLIPLFPDFGTYINTILITVLPIFILTRLNVMFNYYELRRIKSSRYNSKKMVLYSFITFSLLTIVVLTSGMFKYRALAIGSGSMTPTISKGDAIILEHFSEKDLSKLKKGDVLVYNHDNKIIVHRLIKMKKMNNNIYYKTKGDNNDTQDSWLVKGEEVIGVVRLKIKFIGIPTVALNELLSRW